MVNIPGGGAMYFPRYELTLTIIHQVERERVGGKAEGGRESLT